MDSTRPSLPLAAALAAARAVDESSLVLMSDRVLLAEAAGWEALGRVVDAHRVAMAGEIAERSRASLGSDGLASREGFSKPAELLEGTLLVSGREARRRVQLAADVKPRAALDGSPLPPLFPHVAAALAAGTVGVDSAEVITRSLGEVAERAHPDKLEAAERALVLQAATVSPDCVRVASTAWVAFADPDGAAPSEEVQRRRRSFRVGSTGEDGMTRCTVIAPPEEAAILRDALRACKKSIWNAGDSDREREGDNPTHPMAARDRENRQQDFDSLFGLIRAGIAATHSPNLSEAGSGVLPSGIEVIVHVDANDLAAGKGAGWFDAAGLPVSIPTIERLTCSNPVRLLVTGGQGEPLYLSRRMRRFSKAQKLAIAARDGGCAMPGCIAPVSFTDVHHARSWADGGRTDVTNGVLLCVRHHHWLHANPDLDIVMVDGLPHLIRKSWQLAKPTPGHRMRTHPIRLTHQYRQHIGQSGQDPRRT